MHGALPAIQLHGMLGIGDNLHSRAILRDLLSSGNPAWLHSHYSAMFHDLIAHGLKVAAFPQKHRMERIRERQNYFTSEMPPRGSSDRLTYSPEAIKAKGSILAAMYHTVGMKMPAKPDFSLPVPQAWRDWAREKVGPTQKPILVYRPIVLNDVWHAPARSPDPESYRTLFKLVRDRFHVVSIADLTVKNGKKEWIVGDEQDADTRFHHGEISFEELAGLFAEAALVFGNPGFAPVLAQAVGTPVICVYGGNESFRTTNSVGAHLAPTLAIEPIHPCECHSRVHACDKRIDMDAARVRVEEFVMQQLAPKVTVTKVLIFATMYVDTEDKRNEVRRWADLHEALNPGIDLLLVDSNSPLNLAGGFRSWGSGAKDWRKFFSFPDNIGHLSRGGRDGWGRAFCKGLQEAIDGGYDYAVHIEGDSLFRLPVKPIVEEMLAKSIKVASVPVGYTGHQRATWVETGLMFFDVGWLKERNFIARYDWPNRKERPTPEVIIRQICGAALVMMPWNAERADKNEITADNVIEFDWVTHIRNDGGKAYDLFAEAALAPSAKAEVEVGRPVRLNFGCGSNHLPGWSNFDNEIDISKPLPFADKSADFILAEHVVEHVDYESALRFFKECRRVLKGGGVLRVAVPSIEQVWHKGTQDYFRWVHEKKWAPTPDVYGAIDALLHQHGHRAPWTFSLLRVTLFAAGFYAIEQRDPGLSNYTELRGVEGHGRVIGEAFNAIETVVCEAS